MRQLWFVLALAVVASAAPASPAFEQPSDHQSDVPSSTAVNTFGCCEDAAATVYRQRREGKGFQGWGGKRTDFEQGESSEDRAGHRQNDGAGFGTWGGKRSQPMFMDEKRYNPWRGKRKPTYNTWGGKRGDATFGKWAEDQETRAALGVPDEESVEPIFAQALAAHLNQPSNLFSN